MVTGDVDPDAGGVIAQNLLGHDGNLRVHALLLLKVPEAKEDERDKNGDKDQHQRLISPAT